MASDSGLRLGLSYVLGEKALPPPYKICLIFVRKPFPVQNHLFLSTIPLVESVQFSNLASIGFKNSSRAILGVKKAPAHTNASVNASVNTKKKGARGIFPALFLMQLFACFQPCLKRRATFPQLPRIHQPQRRNLSRLHTL